MLFGALCSTREFSFVWKCRHYQWSVSKSALMAIKKWGFFSVPHLYCDTGHSFKWSSLRTRDTHTVCRAFSSWALTSCCVTTCFYDLGLSGLGFVHITFRMRGESFNRLRHSNGVYQATFIIRSNIQVRRIAQQFYTILRFLLSELINSITIRMRVETLLPHEIRVNFQC